MEEIGNPDRTGGMRVCVMLPRIGVLRCSGEDGILVSPGAPIKKWSGTDRENGGYALTRTGDPIIMSDVL